MLRITPAIGIDVASYASCVHSEFHVEHRTIEVDQGQGPLVPVVFSFIVNALDVVVAKKRDDISAYSWIRAHTVNNTGTHNG